MADAFGDEAEPAVTLNEYLEDMEAAELEVDMVLGGDEGKECTYPSGYMKRQAIFSCLTCVPGGDAGVCTACSLTCHDGHEIVELWTKRNFRCDCGNSKFGLFFCKLFAGKDVANSENNYNQNFRGSYCTCHRPYPDPESEEQYEMIQCCICEDWFHENHIGLGPTEEVPRDEEEEPLYEDFICPDCALVVSFLKFYPSSIWASFRDSSTITSEQSNKVLENGTGWKSSNDIGNGSCSSTLEASIGCPLVASSTTLSIEKDSVTISQNLEGDITCSKNKSLGRCLLGIDLSKSSVEMEKKKPLFLSKGWREHLCRCSTCCELYTQKGVDYLIDTDDSIEEYQKTAQIKRQEKLQKQESAHLEFMNTMDHVQKMEVLNGIADIKNEISSFLESLGDSSKTITSADVQVIVENLAKKRRRMQ